MHNHYSRINGRELVGMFLEDHTSEDDTSLTTSFMIILFNIMR